MCKHLRSLPIFRGWRHDIERLDPTELEHPLHKKDIGLLMLYLLRYSLTRMRSSSSAAQGELVVDDRVDYEDIIIMCLRDAYVKRLDLENCVVHVPKM